MFAEAGSAASAGGRGGGRRGGGGGNSDSINLSISGSPDDLEIGFQLAYLLLTEPKIEQVAFDTYKTGIREVLEESMHNPMRLGDAPGWRGAPIRTTKRARSRSPLKRLTSSRSRRLRRGSIG